MAESTEEQTIRSGATARIVLEELRSKVYHVAVIVALMLVGSGVNLLQPLLFRELLDTAIPTADTTLVLSLLVGLMAVPASAICLMYVQDFLKAYVGNAVSQALRKRLFEHVLHARMEDAENVSTGEIIFRITRQCGQLGEEYVARELLPVLSNVVVLFGAYAIMVYLNWKLALVSAVVFPPSYYLSVRLARRSRELDRRFTDVLEEGEQFLIETFHGLRTIRALNGEAREKKWWWGWLDRHRSITSKVNAFHDLILNLPNEFMNNIGIACLFGYGAYLVIQDALSIGTLMAFTMYTPRAYGAVRAIMNAHIGTERVKVAAGKIDELFALRTEPALATVELPTLRNVGVAIEFKDVSFHYSRGFGVKNLSFRVEKGEFLGIVGPTGGGKSTIFDLLMGFYIPESGAIYTDGLDISEVSLKSLRENIGSVSQNVFLWNTTLRRNIIYPHDEFDEGKVIRAVHLTRMDEFAGNQPEGYDTVVGENGIMLSGGERQRLAIARAIIREPRILLMDEGTSALDALTEAKVRDLIDRAGNGRTKIVIAHRLATVLHADRIIVVDEGRIAESGTPAELIAKRRMFFRLFEAQSLEIGDRHEQHRTTSAG